jgi:hypothetical protein
MLSQGVQVVLSIVLPTNIEIARTDFVIIVVFI